MFKNVYVRVMYYLDFWILLTIVTPFEIWCITLIQNNAQ